MILSSIDSLVQAHGGLQAWRAANRLNAKIQLAGDLWATKAIVHDAHPRSLTADLHRPWLALQPFGGPERIGDFTPYHVAIEAPGGRILSERDAPERALAGRGPTAPWDGLDRLYVTGLLIWLGLTAPFLAATGATAPDGALTLQALAGVVSVHRRQPDANGRLERYDLDLSALGMGQVSIWFDDYVQVDGIWHAARWRLWSQAQGRDDTAPPLVSVALSELVLS